MRNNPPPHKKPRSLTQLWRATTVAVLALAATCTLNANNPFLIVQESEYAALQAKADNEPFATAKTNAIDNALNLSYDATLGLQDRATRLTKINQSIGLAYILDPAQRATYRANFLSENIAGLDNLWPLLDEYNWPYYVPPGNAFVSTIITYDILYDDLTATERSSIDTRLSQWGTWYTNKNGPWLQMRWGAPTIWSLFSGTGNLNSLKNNFYNQYFPYLKADGSTSNSAGYIGWRHGASQSRSLAKRHTIDILEYTGTDNRYYNSPNFGNLFNYVVAFNLTPFRSMDTIGDALTWPSNQTFNWFTGYEGAHHFTHANLPALEWLREGRTFAGAADVLMGYLLAARAPSTSYAPQPPASSIFPDAGAALWEKNHDSEGLKGMLVNFTTHDGHLHKATNSVVLTAYGENVLVDPANNYSQEWRDLMGNNWYSFWRENSYLNNVVEINNQNHAQVESNGISDGFVGGSIEYAKASDGPAISNGEHTREFVFIQPSASTIGYFATFDTVDPNNASHQANALWHPNAPTTATVAANTEYEASIGGDFTPTGSTDVKLSIFLATPPASASFYDSEMGGSTVSGYKTLLYKALKANYNTASNGNAEFLTLLVPHDSANAKPALTRISPNGYTGAKVSHSGSIEDFLLQSDGTATATQGAVSLQAKKAAYRIDNGSVPFFFAADARSFDDGNTIRYGFSAPSNATVFLEGDTGHVSVPATTNVTFFEPGVQSASLGGAPATIVGTGTDQITLSVPAGSHSLVLSDSPPTSSNLFVNTSQYPVLSYDSGVQDFGSAEVLNAGVELKLTGNAWKKVNLGSYTVTPNTVLSFDFKAATQGEIHGILLDNNDSMGTDDKPNAIQVHGTQAWATGGTYSYTGGGNWQNYSIPLGTLISNTTFSELVFMADDDANANQVSHFREIDLFEFGSGGVGPWVHLENKHWVKYLQGANDIDGAIPSQCGTTYNVRGNSTARDGTWTQWRFIEAGGGWYHLENNEFGYYLYADDAYADLTQGDSNCGGTDAKAVAGVGTSCTGDKTQWKKVDAGGGYFYLQNKSTGGYLQCLDTADVDSNGFDNSVQVREVDTSCSGDWAKWKEVLVN